MADQIYQCRRMNTTDPTQTDQSYNPDIIDEKKTPLQTQELRGFRTEKSQISIQEGNRQQRYITQVRG